MSYITLKNDRKRRRQARVVTFIVTLTMLSAAAYGVGALDQLTELLHQYMGSSPVDQPVASLI